MLTCSVMKIEIKERETWWASGKMKGQSWLKSFGFNKINDAEVVRHLATRSTSSDATMTTAAH